MDKKNIKKIIFVVLAIIVILCIIIAIVFGVNSKSTNKPKSEKIEKSSSYDGKNELGTLVEFKIKEIEKPKAVKDGGYVNIGDNKWHYQLDAEGNAINIYTTGDYKGNVSIPNMIDGHKVISIGENVSIGGDNSLFQRSKKDITSVEVPDGVKYIGINAFSGMDNLEKVILPDSVIYIGDDAFNGSKNLAYINSNVEGKVIMPKSLQYYGESLFRYNEKINSFEFPKQIDYIQDWTFYETRGFEDLVISQQFKYIGSGAFAESSISSLNIEEGVEIIGDSAFNINNKLKKVNIASSVNCIQSSAFSICLSLSDVTYNGKLKYIGRDVFANTKVGNVLQDNQLP